MQIGYYFQSPEDENFELDPRFGTFLVTQVKVSDYGRNVEFLEISQGKKENCDYSLWPDDETAKVFFGTKNLKCFDKSFYINGKPINEENNHVRIQFFPCPALNRIASSNE